MNCFFIFITFFNIVGKLITFIFKFKKFGLQSFFTSGALKTIQSLSLQTFLNNVAKPNPKIMEITILPTSLYINRFKFIYKLTDKNNYWILYDLIFVISLGHPTS